MTRIPLTLGKHYVLIDSPISFFLVDNEENSVYRPSGVWQLDSWKLLPEKYQKDHPVYTLTIEYDEGKLVDGKEVIIRESDIDLGDGVAGVSGQAVMITGINDSLLPIPVSVKNLPDVQKVSVENPVTSVAVKNFPANQKVTVSNFPANQGVTVSNLPDVFLSRSTLCCSSYADVFTDFKLFSDFLQKNALSLKLVLIKTSLSAGETHLLVRFDFPVFVGSGFIAFCGYYKNVSDNTDYFSERFRLYHLDSAAFVQATVYYG